MQFRRLFALLLTLLALHLFSFAPVMAQSEGDKSGNSVASTESQLPPAAQADVPMHFKSGVKYDPTSKQWLDRNTGKVVDLGIPGLNGKYGASEILADSSTSTQNAVNTTSGFPWKKFIIITVMIAGIATAIAVPVAVGAAHHHNNNANTQNNQAAAYYFFHNQTLPIPTVPHGPNPFVPSGGKPPPPAP